MGNPSSSSSSTSLDLECGGGQEEEEEEEEEEECCFYSTCGGQEDDEIDCKDCRICHLSLDDDDDDAIQLGCSCKNDLAAAHKHCADTWFKIKGNKTCEICNSIVTNLVVVETSTTAHGHGAAVMDLTLEPTTPSHRSSTRDRGLVGGGGCINGHRLLNFILACLVFAFVISWLFHFNIPS